MTGAATSNGIRREKSYLELLSDTAAWKNVIERSSSNSSNSEHPVKDVIATDNSSARITPAELHVFIKSVSPERRSTPTMDSSHSLATSSSHYQHHPPDSVHSFDESTLSFPPVHSFGASSPEVGQRTTIGLTSIPSQASLPSFVSTHSSTAVHASLPRAFLPPRPTHLPSVTAETTDVSGAKITQSSKGSEEGFANASLLETAATSSFCRPLTSWQHQQLQQSEHQQRSETTPSPTQLMHENAYLKDQLRLKDQSLMVLHDKIAKLEAKIEDLRQLPTGKISQIPIEDMVQIMQEYGSEISDVVMPPRKPTIQKASIVRQFRRWNPNFFEFFTCVKGKWMPKLGKQGELHRRMQARKQAQMEKRKTPGTDLVTSSDMDGTASFTATEAASNTTTGK